MRVIAGTARSVPLIAPEGGNTRPTTDIIKETLFNMIQFDLAGCEFLDLFAGSGAIGIEALSRGAGRAYFSDTSREAIRCIEYNLKRCHLEENAVILAGDALRALSRIRMMTDTGRPRIIFLDPPYDRDLEVPVMEKLPDCIKARPADRVILETSLTGGEKACALPGYRLIREKKYKNQKHCIFRFDLQDASDDLEDEEK